MTATWFQKPGVQELKMRWVSDEREAFDVLTMVFVVHRALESVVRWMPRRGSA